jgi:hypothetical protein
VNFSKSKSQQEGSRIERQPNKLPQGKYLLIGKALADRPCARALHRKLVIIKAEKGRPS